MGERRSRTERWGHSTPGSAEGKGSERLWVVLVLGLRVRVRAETRGLNSLPENGALSITEKGQMGVGKASQWDLREASLSGSGTAGPQHYPRRGTAGMAVARRCQQEGALSPSWDCGMWAAHSSSAQVPSCAEAPTSSTPSPVSDLWLHGLSNTPGLRGDPRGERRGAASSAGCCHYTCSMVSAGFTEHQKQCLLNQLLS